MALQSSFSSYNRFEKIKKLVKSSSEFLLNLHVINSGFKMKNLSSLFFSLFVIILSCNLTFGQVGSVKFEVKVPSEGMQKNSSVFLTGSFNGWNPHDSMYIMQKTGDDLYSLIIPVFDGKKYEYKYTLGSWNSVEVSANGEQIKNRKMITQDGLTIKDTVLKWKSPKLPTKKDTTLKFSKKQMEEIKAEIMIKIKDKMKNTLGILKKAFVNMLSDKPDMKLRKKYHKQIVSSINNVLDLAADALWKAVSVFTPEQKKALLKEMKKSKDPGAFFNIITKAMSAQHK